MSVQISQRMFSEVMPAFTEMFMMKSKNSEKRALFSIKCSRGAFSIVDKIENWKNTKRKKTTSVDEKEKDEVKLHAALVLILLSGQFTNLEGFQRQSELNYFSLPATRREKSLCIEAKLRTNYD